MKTEDIEYHADGARLVGYLAVDDARPGKRPGVLVAPEGGGLVDLTKSIARRLAEAGYVAFAMDYYGDGKPLADLREAMPRIMAFMADPTGIRARATAALDVLTGQPEIDAGAARRHRLLLRRHDGPRAGPQRRRPQGGRRLPFRPRHGPAAGRHEHQGQGAGVHRRGRSDHPARAARRLREGDDRRRRRLADEPLWRRRPQLHQPRRGRAGPAGLRIPRRDGPPLVARHARPLRRNPRRGAREPA